MKSAVNAYAVAAGEVDLGQLLRRRRRRPARRSRTRRPASCPASGAARPAPPAARRRTVSASRTPGSRVRDRADQRAGLHRPRERAEPAEVDVDLAAAADTRRAAPKCSAPPTEIAGALLALDRERAHALGRRARCAARRRGTRGSSSSVAPTSDAARAGAAALGAPSRARSSRRRRARRPRPPPRAPARPPARPARSRSPSRSAAATPARSATGPWFSKTRRMNAGSPVESM